MKIIKPGIVLKKEIPKLIGTCINCGCIVECLPTEPDIIPWSLSYPCPRIICPTKNCNYHPIRLEDSIARIS